VSDHLEANWRVAKVMESSAVLGVLDRVLRLLWRAAADSVAVATTARWAHAWSGLEAPLRRVAVGTTLIVAVTAHLVLMVATQIPSGWLWLVMPSIFAAIGLLLIVASGVPEMSRR
jgi:hypothetical protein